MQNTVSYFHSRGTLAGPTASQAGDTLGSNFAYGYGTSYVPVGGFSVQAQEAFSATAGGTSVGIFTTPLTTQALTEAVRVFPSGGVGIGETGTDPGIGSLQLNAQFFMPNITTSSAAQTGTVCWTTGTGKFTVDTTLGCLASSERFKERIEPMQPEDCVRIVMKLQTISFFKRREHGGDLDPAEQIGFRAEQVASVDQRLTASVDGQVKGVRYMQDSAIYACAFQALKADNDNLHAANDNLATQLIELKKQRLR